MAHAGLEVITVNVPEERADIGTRATRNTSWGTFYNFVLDPAPLPGYSCAPPPRGGSLHPCLLQKPASRVQAAVSPASPNGHRRSPQTPSSCPPPALEEGRWVSAEPSLCSQQAEQILGVLWVGRRDAATVGCPGPGPVVTGLGGSWEGEAGHRLMSVTSVGVLVGWLAG